MLSINKSSLLVLSFASFMQLACGQINSTSEQKNEAKVQKADCQNRKSVESFANCVWDLAKSTDGVISQRAESRDMCNRKAIANTVVIAPVNDASQFFCSVDQKIFNKDTFATLIGLLGSYIADTAVRDPSGPRREQEISDFLDAILAASVMGNLKDWLLKNRQITKFEYDNFKEALYDIWFTPIRRGTSSGFEHVFVGEVKKYDNTVGGYHSWVKYYLDELPDCNNRRCSPAVANYVKAHPNSQKRLDRIMENRSSPNRIVVESTWILNQQEYKKKVGSFFLGTTPETEFALGTLAYFNGDFSFILDGHEEELRVFYHQEGDKKVIRTVF